MTNGPKKLPQKLPSESVAEYRARLAKLGLLKPKAEPEVPQPSPVKHDSDLIPDVLPERSEVDQELDSVINNLDILDAYKLWCNKKIKESTQNQREGIKVSCPVPGHTDNDPSCWLNRDKGTWYCGKCEEGGDAYDLAAIYYDYPRPGYKEGESFHKIRRDIASALGYGIRKVADKEIIYKDAPEIKPEQGTSPLIPNVQSTPESTQKVDPAPPTPAEPSQNTVSSDELKTESAPADLQGFSSLDKLDNLNLDSEPEEDIGYSSINWKDIVPEETFLYEYMKACSLDDSPEEYHFWHGLLALGHALGRKTVLFDHNAVLANLFICLLGGTGYGKSRSRYHLEQLLNRTFPFADNGLEVVGVKLIKTPGSPEYLASVFSQAAKDPSLPKNTGVYLPVNGLVNFSEFSKLVNISARNGTDLKPPLMDLYDGVDPGTGTVTRGEIKVRDPYCSVTSSTQPKAVRQIMSRADAASGFLNRWVFAGGPPKERISALRPGMAKTNLDDASSKLSAVHSWSENTPVIEYTDPGYDAWTEFFKNKIVPLQNQDDTHLLQRLDLLFKKIFLLFTANEHGDHVTEDVVERASTLINYLVDCYNLLNSEIGVSLQHEMIQELLRHIKRHYEKKQIGASLRDLRMYTKRKGYTDRDMDFALTIMSKTEQILEQSNRRKDGRAATRWIPFPEENS